MAEPMRFMERAGVLSDKDEELEWIVHNENAEFILGVISRWNSKIKAYVWIEITLRV